jgi:pimeloyl-ACP methyl ester carboxylesterase
MTETAGLFVRDLGAGDPVVVLHPGPGLDGSVFLPGVHALSEAGHRVLLVDLPGNGRSPDGDRGEWTLAGYAHAVQRLAEALELEDWTLLGHSFGGYVALTHLIEHPGRASRLIASCTDADEQPPAGMAPIPEPEGAELEAFERAAAVASPEDCRAAWLGLLPHCTPQPERAAAMLNEVSFRPDVQHPRDWGELHALDALAASSIPVLAIGTGSDPAFPFALAERIAASAPNGRAVLLEQCGHFPFAEDPGRYWGEIAGWLDVTKPRSPR